MDRLEMAISLIEEAQEERRRLIGYERAYLEAFEKDTADPNKYTWENRNKVFKAYHPIPKKSVINDNLKMARRILLGEYMK